MNTQFLTNLIADTEWEFRFYYPYIEFDGGNEGKPLAFVLSTIAIVVGVFILFRVFTREGD